ncbi:hypothetical protein MJ575_14265 [Klebsiella pneumoniae]|nr:hypothetical protein MJ575_14265 [Klebsiella pneumoniae]
MVLDALSEQDLLSPGVALRVKAVSGGSGLAPSASPRLGAAPWRPG